MNELFLNRSDIQISEKRNLRAKGIKLKEIHHYTVRDLRSILGVSELRALELRAISEFQSIPSIGARFVENLMQLGFYSLKDIRGKDPAKLINKLELQTGVWIDPCVEDQFRLVVYYADHPGSLKNWWDFTNERKIFRQKNGYPSNRPSKPWFDSEQYKTVNQIDVSTKTAKIDLHKKLKSAIKYMKENMESRITIAELSDIAHISTFHFIRLFKSAYELTPIQYLTRLRMKKACQLLKKTEHSVGRISLSCGFNNESSFIRLFKKEFMMTPLNFRKNNQINN